MGSRGIKKTGRSRIVPFLFAIVLAVSIEPSALTLSAAGQTLKIGTVRVEPTIEDFRFWTVAKVPVFAESDLQIRESKKDAARAVGSLPKNGLLYVLEDKDDGWLYTESGEVRGFVRANEVRSGQGAVRMPDNAPTARELVPRSENAAFTYLRATTRRVAADAIYALADKEDVLVYEECDENSRSIGAMNKGDLCCVLEGVARVDVTGVETLRRGEAEETSVPEERLYTIIGLDEWLYIESGNVRGFVKSSGLRADDELQTELRASGTDNYGTATQRVSIDENTAFYHSLRSVKGGVPEGGARESVATFAMQFLGTPYVVGGTDLVSGTDADGFVWAVYAQYEYYLPRLADRQVSVGAPVTGDPLPGDLLFFKNSEENVDRVAICAGGGKMIEASADQGKVVLVPMESGYFRAARIIQDEVYSAIPTVYSGYPVGTGNCYTVTHNYGRRKWANPCRRIHQKWVEAGSVYTDNVATIDGCYLIACTSLFGTVGDVIVWRFEDGSTLTTIMADTKSSGDPNYTVWGHITGKVINVLEFETDALIHPGTAKCIPQIAGKRVMGWINLGRAL